MDYEKKYKEALERAKEQLESARAFDYKEGQIAHDIRTVTYAIFPELKESEDEKIKNELAHYFTKGKEYLSLCSFSKEEILAWLEKQDADPNMEYWRGYREGMKDILDEYDELKRMLEKYEELKGQGEQILANSAKTCKDEQESDDVEPKFHEGDWTVSDLDKMVRQISEVHCDEYNSYYVVDGKSVNLEEYDRIHHLWTIQDAKDGDVLACDDETIVILKDLYNATTFHSYCHIEDGLFDVSKDEMPVWWGWGGFRPATKEQRDTLMKAMADAGYTFDFEKKKLKKIENEITIPFGAKDSELQEAIYYIPKGFHAEIDDDKVVIKKGENVAWSEEDEGRLQSCLNILQAKGIIGVTDTINTKWLKSLKQRLNNA